MTLSPNEAADTLRDIAATETHSRQLYGYREASPHLIFWGILWAVGYGLSWFLPQHGAAIWGTIVTVGSLASYFTAFRAASRRNRQAGTPIHIATRRAASEVNWTLSAISFIAALFIAAALAVVSPVTPRQVGAFIPLVVAAGYAVMGLWLGLRLTVAGAVLAILTLGGFFLLPTHFQLWMAACGSGSLILGGIWLRSA
jgi:hypothetical protein